MHSRQNRIRFADFEADFATGELFHHGRKVPLQQKPFLILRLLLQNPGELVSRDELSAQLWPDTYVQKDLSLNTAVRKLRQALGEHGRDGTFVETVGSRGYRFVAPVEIPPEVRARLHGSPTHPMRIAVLPFENLAGEEHEFFSDGITEQVIARLGRMHRHISVVAPVSAMQYKRTSKPTAQIARELNAGFLLSGSVAPSADKVRVTARLIRGADQSCVWSETYSRVHQEVFAIQDDITEQIARSLLRVLPEAGALEPSRPTSHEVYRKFLRANYYALRWEEHAFRRAIQLYEEVLGEDPDYAPAYGAYAMALCPMTLHGVLAPREVRARVEGLCEQALALDPDSETAWIARSWSQFFHLANLEAAQQSCARALAINPSSAMAHLLRSQIMSVLHRHDECIESARKAVDLDPQSVAAQVILACGHYYARRYDEAEGFAREALEMDAHYPTAHAALGWILEQKGDAASAARHYALAEEASGGSGIFKAHHARGLALLGDTEGARRLLDEIGALRQSVYVPTFWIGLALLALGETECALGEFEASLRDGGGWRLSFAIEPRLDPLREHPRFLALLDAIGLPRP